jgi:hypothetical protein
MPRLLLDQMSLLRKFDRYIRPQEENKTDDFRECNAIIIQSIKLTSGDAKEMLMNRVNPIPQTQHHQAPQQRHGHPKNK